MALCATQPCLTGTVTSSNKLCAGLRFRACPHVDATSAAAGCVGHSCMYQGPSIKDGAMAEPQLTASAHPCHTSQLNQLRWQLVIQWQAATASGSYELALAVGSIAASNRGCVRHPGLVLLT